MNKRFSLGNMDQYDDHYMNKSKKNNKTHYPIITHLPKKRNFFFRKLFNCSCIYNKKVYDT
jgi:hypothetical protein